jgi:hypothetical protein
MRFLVIALGLLALTTRYATGAEVPPSDNELSAAYCWGALTAETAILQSLANKPGRDSAELRAVKNITTSNDQKILRYRDYLVSKGFLGDRDPLPILIAKKHGADDGTSCMNNSADLAASLDLPECKRAQKCETVDKDLPF